MRRERVLLDDALSRIVPLIPTPHVIPAKAGTYPLALNAIPTYRHSRAGGNPAPRRRASAPILLSLRRPSHNPVKAGVRRRASAPILLSL